MRLESDFVNSAFMLNCFCERLLLCWFCLCFFFFSEIGLSCKMCLLFGDLATLFTSPNAETKRAWCASGTRANADNHLKTRDIVPNILGRLVESSSALMTTTQFVMKVVRPLRPPAKIGLKSNKLLAQLSSPFRAPQNVNLLHRFILFILSPQDVC